MKKVLLAVVVLALVSGSAFAQGKISLGIGGDIILPLDSGFKNAYSIGFGGTVRGQYWVNDQFSATLTTGYLIFSAKDLGGGFKLDNASMIPILVGGKYYFSPGTMRFYGAVDIGISIFSVGVPAIVTAFGTFGGGTASSSEFTFQPQLGFESALGSGGSKLDVGVRAIIISNALSMGARVGVLFPIGS